MVAMAVDQLCQASQEKGSIGSEGHGDLPHNEEAITFKSRQSRQVFPKRQSYYQVSAMISSKSPLYHHRYILLIMLENLSVIGLLNYAPPSAPLSLSRHGSILFRRINLNSNMYAKTQSSVRALIIPYLLVCC